jgi:hypothetical protein
VRLEKRRTNLEDLTKGQVAPKIAQDARLAIKRNVEQCKVAKIIQAKALSNGKIIPFFNQIDVSVVEIDFKRDLRVLLSELQKDRHDHIIRSELVV